MTKNSFKFIDLFAGIGGFHQAMRYLGGECVMAAEIDPHCVATYKENYNVKNIQGDVSKIDPLSIPDFDVLCAGFPCQPFSKAGAQRGFEDPGRGNLFYSIIGILDHHPNTKFIILENVRNLADKTENWEVIKEELMSRNFYITEQPLILNPINFGIPQNRERVYILAINKDIRNEEILTNGFIHEEDLSLETKKKKKKCNVGDVYLYLEENVPENYRVSPEKEEILAIWEEFRESIVPGTLARPTWINSFGHSIDDCEKFHEQIGYASMPEWKKKIVDKNRKMYLSNRVFIDGWLDRNLILNRSKIFQKFEWNCGDDDLQMSETVIQFRQSGVRVKRSNYFPSLVAIANTPIIWDSTRNYYREITPREAGNIQNFHKNFKFLGSETQIYKQLGNSVNVRLLKIIGERLFRLAIEGWDELGNE